MTWTVPSLGPPRVDFSWISSLADPVLERMQQQQDAANIMKAADTNWQQPQVSAPGGLAALGGTPGVAQPQSGASMGFSTRAQREGGNSAPFEPLFAQAGQKYGISPDYLRTTIGIESNYNPNAQNPNSSAGGLGQFIDSTAKKYGLTNKFDPAQSVDATARYAADNKAQLAASLGREPTNGELYMAHQQGVGGAAKILTANPDAPIASVIGANKANINGGAGLTVAQFRQKYESNFGGQQPAAQQQGAMQQTGMQPAAAGSVADRSIVPGSRPNPVAMDQNQAAGNGDLADLQSIVMNPRSPPNMREWAIGELAKRGIKVPAQQGVQAPPQAADPSLAAGQRPITPPPGYTPEQVAAAQAAAAQGPAQGQQRALANQPAAGASEVQRGFDVGGGRMVPVDQANNYAQPQQPQPPQNIQPPAQQQPQPTPQQVVGSVPVQAVTKFNPQQKAVLAGLLSSPGTRQLGMALIQKQLDPGHFGFTTIGSTVYRHNDKTGAFEPLMQVPKDVKWGYTLVNGRLVAHNDVDPSMTRDSTPANMPPGARPFTPEERRAFGIGEDDSGYMGAGEIPHILKSQKVSVDASQKQESEFGKRAGAALASRFEKITEQGDTAAKNQQLISRLREAGGQIQGGTGGGAALRAWLADRGIKIGDDIGAVEAYGAAIDQMTPNQRPAGAGSTSNFEEALYKRSLPNLVKTPEGNKFILDTMDGLNQLDLKRSAIATRALLPNSDPDKLDPGEALKQMNALNKDMAAINAGVKQKYIELQKAGALGAEGRAGQQQPLPPAQGGWDVIDGVKIRKKQ